MDVDGTLTDGKIYIGNEGELFKAFNSKDGCGIKNLLVPSGIIPIILTGRTSEIVENRCKEIGVKLLFQDVTDKVNKLKSIVKDCSRVAYIGDDLNDLGCVKLIKKQGGIIGCPMDACESIRNLADFISDKRGGDGAVRDFIEWLLF